MLQKVEGNFGLFGCKKWNSQNFSTIKSLLYEVVVIYLLENTEFEIDVQGT